VKRQTTVRIPVRQIVQAERRRMLLQKEGMRGVIKESYSASQCVCTMSRMGDEHFISRRPFPRRGRGTNSPDDIAHMSHSLRCTTGRLHQEGGSTPLNTRFGIWSLPRLPDVDVTVKRLENDLGSATIDISYNPLIHLDTEFAALAPFVFD
jgi:hypothetical protein